MKNYFDSSSKGYSRKGAALHGLGKLDDAVVAYSQGLKIEPENAQLKQALDEVEKVRQQRSQEGKSPMRVILKILLSQNFTITFSYI